MKRINHEECGPISKLDAEYLQEGVKCLVTLLGVKEYGNTHYDDRSCMKEQVVAEAWGLTNKYKLKNKYCRHCKKKCWGQICRECFRRNTYSGKIRQKSKWRNE